MTDGILFGGWDAIARIVVVGILAHAAVVLVVRLSGKRNLASMNAFDFIVNIAIGSVLATTIVARSTPLFDGSDAFLVLFGLQSAVTLVTSRSKRAGRIVRSEPRLLVHDGTLLFDAMHEERVSESETLQAIRSEGVRSLEGAAAVVLESNGNLSVLGRQDGPPGLRGVRGP